MNETPMDFAEKVVRTEESTAGRAERSWTCHPAILAGLLMVLALAAYWPALHCGFIWDDDLYVTQNPMLTDADGLHEIWFTANTQSQYFPLVYTTLRIERAMWGLNPVGYHLVNILLHGLNAALVWIILRRLFVPGAWLAAAIFALHPVQVETVAWVAELKNIESLLFYLLAVLAWMKFIEPAGRPRWWFYTLALVFYVLALFAKKTACTLPAVLALVVWLRGQRFDTWRVVQILPFLAIGLGLGLLTVWWEKHLGDYQESFGLAFTFMDKLLIATRALWFYAGKLIWPANLTISYPRWDIDPAHPWQYLPLAACLAVAVALWVWRQKIGRGAIAGVIFFVAALSPLLGFIVEGSFHYTYVADHYQYNACIGLIAIFAALAWRWLGRTPVWLPFQAALLLLLGFLASRQCAPYRNLETLWKDTLAKNPASWMAHHNLGIVYFEQGRLDEAIGEDKEAVALYPQGGSEQADLGTALLKKGLYTEAIQYLETAVAINPKLFQAQNSLGLAYSKIGDYGHAEAHLRQALQLQPNALGAMMNLGAALERQGRLGDAIEVYYRAAKEYPTEVAPLRRLPLLLNKEGQYSQAIEACKWGLILAPNDEQFLLAMGNAYLGEGDYAGAAESYRKALQLEPKSAGLHYNLALVLGLQGNAKGERDELVQSLHLDPGFAPAWQELVSLGPKK
jgi:protein O-mannosyl-transferase